ncbi:MAG: MobQ family relaxase [Bacillota bacterium]
MAIFYMNAQIIGRSTGRTATGAAAYRAGDRIVDERTGQVFDYTRRRGERESSTYAPAGSPAWVQDRSQLWNAAEKVERRADAQVAREIVVAFPKELSKEQQRELIAGYVQEQFVARGMVADVAIHRNPGNPHAHIMLTMREVGPDGFASKKNREWNNPEMLEHWRKGWSTHSNRALERAGRSERIDHRSLAEQGSEKVPQVHLGPHAAALERRGIATEKGEHNRLAAEHNAVVVELEKAREERQQLKAEKAVVGRYKGRLNAGWLADHGQALGLLEYHHAGGAPLTYQEVVGLHRQFTDQLRQVQAEIHAIRADEYRLSRAAEVLGYRQKAAEKLEQLESPMARIKRWFSESARREYESAREVLGLHDQRAAELGVTSESELNAQRVAWSERNAGIPGLEAQASGLDAILKQAAMALEGFRREYERDDDLLRQRGRRERDGGMDRGR